MRYYSKRELYALGETLGDSVTEHKVGGGRVYGGGGKGGGGGGQPAQTTSTAYQTSIPAYAQPYVETMLGATQKQLFNMDDSGNITGFSPYKPYSTNPQDYVAGFSPLQQQAQQGIANLQTPGEFQTGSDIAGMGAMGAMGSAMQANQAGNNLARQSTNPYAVGAYMNPYIQNALDPALQLSNQQYGIKGAQEQSAATSAGAFGGSRNALMQGLNQQNQMLANNQLIGNAYNQAYGNAQTQMNNVANLGLQGNQAAMQGYGQAANAANTMAGISGQGLTAQEGIYGQQNQVGAAQQAQQQQMINQSISDYANAQQYPLMQLGVMSNMLRGLPMQAATTNQYVAAPNPVTQGIGLAGAGASIYNAMKKEGGVIKEKKMASGGIASFYKGGDVIDSTEADLYDMPPEALAKEVNSPSKTVRDLAQRILREKTGKAGGGIIAFADSTPENNQSVVKEDPAMVRQAYIDAAQAQAASQPKPAAPAVSPKSIVAAAPSAAAVSSDAPKFHELQEPKGNPNAWRGPIDVLSDLYNPKRVDPTGKVVTQREYEAGANTPAPAAAPPAAVNPNANLPAMPTNVKVDPLGRADAANQNPAAPVVNPNSIKAAAKPSVPVTNAPAGDAGSTFGIAPPENPDAGKSMKDLVAEEKSMLGPNAGSQEQRAKLMAEKANAKDEARRTLSLRAAEFFGAWGSTPGNTIVAGLNAMKNKIPDFISDMKDESKIRKEIDKSIYELDKIDREEEQGLIKNASARRKDAAKNAYDVWGKKVEAAAHKYTADASVRAASVRASAAGGGDEKTLEKLIGRRTSIETAMTAAKSKLPPGTEMLAGMPDSKDPTKQANIVAARNKVAEATANLQKDYQEVDSLIKSHKRIKDLTEPNDTSAAAPSKGDTVMVGDKTYTRPASMSDQQWADYKKATGAK